MNLRPVLISELFFRSRAAVSMMSKRHQSLSTVLKIYLIRYLFDKQDWRLSRKYWLRRIEEKKHELISRAKEIESRRRRLKKTNADGFSKYIEALIEEIVEGFKDICYRLRRKWKILFYNECRSLLYKRFWIKFFKRTREHFLRQRFRFSY